MASSQLMVSKADTGDVKPMLSPQQAADRAGVSRATITNAIKAEKLRARQNNEGRWLITHEALEAWMTDRPTVSKAATEDVSLQPEVAVLRERVEGLQALMAKAEAEADRLREQLLKIEAKAEAEKAELKEQLKAEQADRRALTDRLAEAQRRRSLMEILTGKRRKD